MILSGSEKEHLVSCIQYASVMVDIEQLPVLGRLVSVISEDQDLTDDDKIALKNCIHLAMQNHKSNSRIFSPQAVISLGTLVQKLSQSLEPTKESI